MLEPRLGPPLAALLALGACTSPDFGDAKNHGDEDRIYFSGYGVNVDKETKAKALPDAADKSSTALAGGSSPVKAAAAARGWPTAALASTGGPPPGGATELSFEDTARGAGPVAKEGDVVRVHYTGRLTDGTEFDSSVKRNKPFEFPLGKGRVIKGWDQGVVGMKVGGKRTLTVPPDLGYGNRAAGKIPPGSTLVFDIELIEIVPPLPDAQGDDAYKGTALRKFKTAGKVAVSVYKEGEGREAQAGDIVEVHYTGTLDSDGSQFDSSIKRGQPIKFPVGTGRVIKGWDEAIIGMKSGELRRIVIPALMGYGERARPKIPANSDLVFTIELMRVTKGTPPVARPPAAKRGGQAGTRPGGKPGTRPGGKPVKAVPAKPAKPAGQ